MNYSAIARGSHTLNLDEVRVAVGVYQDTIERRLGGDAQAARAFLNSFKADRGDNDLTEADLETVIRWKAALAEAQVAADERLTVPESVEFLIRP